MIKEIVKLPFREIYGDISTVSPVFNFNEGLETVSWVGKEIESSSIRKNFYKYKLVTRVNHNIVERIIFCPEDINFDSVWWKSNAPVHTISSKIINPCKHSSFAQTSRFLNGTMDVLDQCDSFNPTQMTIYDKIKNILGVNHLITEQQFASCILEDQQNANMLNTVVNGKDKDNHDAMQNAYYLAEVVDDYKMTPLTLIDTKMNFIDDYSKFFSKSINVKDMALFKGLETLYSSYKTSIIHFEPPFKIDESVLIMDDNEDRIPVLHDLLQYVEASSYTDIHAFLSLLRPNTYDFKCDLYSDYYGKDVVHEDTATYLTELKNYLLRWLSMEKMRPIAMDFIKNSCEEVFITVLYGKNKVKRYYFDLSIYSLLNHSFVDCEN